MKGKGALAAGILLLLSSLYYAIYCGRIMIELPYLTWFDQMPLIDKFYAGTLRIGDMFSKYGEHGMLANNILWLFNAVFFHGSTLFDVAVNDINVIICGIIAACNTKEIYGEWNLGTTAVVFVESVFMFGAMQSSAGAMETQVRLGILFFLIAMVYVDKSLRGEASRKQYIAAILLVFISINVFGTLYSFSGVPLVWGITVWYMLKRKPGGGNKNLILSICYFLTIPMYVFEYRIWEVLIREGTKAADLNPANFIKGLCAWLANGALSYSYYNNKFWNEQFYLAAGSLILIMVIGAVIIFFREKLYERSWIPLMCITYSFGVYVMVYLGRASDWMWFINEWYNVHIKIALAAVVCIYGYYVVCCAGNISKAAARILVMGIALICGLGIMGNYCCLQRASSLHAYFLEKQKYLYISDRDMMPVNGSGQTPLLETLDKTMDAISIMKKYNLSVYQYWDSYKECATTPLEGDEIKWLAGRYGDGWIEQTASFRLNTYEADTVAVGYYALKSQEVTLKVNSMETGEAVKIAEGAGSFEVLVPRNSVVTIEIISNYSRQLSNIDLRQCSFIVSDVVRGG